MDGKVKMSETLARLQDYFNRDSVIITSDKVPAPYIFSI